MYRVIKASTEDENLAFDSKIKKTVDELFPNSVVEFQYDLDGRQKGLNLYGDFYVNELLALAEDEIPDWVDIEDQDFWRIQFSRNPKNCYCLWNTMDYGLDLINYLNTNYPTFFESEHQINQAVIKICNQMSTLCDNLLYEERYSRRFGA